MARFLPYGRQSLNDDDIKAVTDVLRSDFLTTGPVVDDFEAALNDYFDPAHSVVCANGTAALHLACMAAGLGPGDLAIVPAITFVATANAVRMCGADVVFADIDPHFGLLTLDSFKVALATAGRAVKAVLPVHLNGHMVDPAVIDYARSKGITVISDACHAMGGSMIYRGEQCRPGDGVLEDLATFSLHPVKPITMGEGGIITTRNPDQAAYMRRMRHHGMIRHEDSEDGDRWSYTFAELGYNYRATDMQCALGLSQFSRLAAFQARREQLAQLYALEIKHRGLPVSPVLAPEGRQSGWHLFVVHLDPKAFSKGRLDFMKAMADKGVGTQIHYPPLPAHPLYHNARRAEIAGAMTYFEGCVSLPLFPDMEEGDVIRVLDAMGGYLGRA